MQPVALRRVPILILKQVRGPLQADFTEVVLAVFHQLLVVGIVPQHRPLVIRTALRDGQHARLEASVSRACFRELILQAIRWLLGALKFD